MSGAGRERAVGINFTICSMPHHISFECPHCKTDVVILWENLEPPKYWGDQWNAVDCPECGKSVELGDWTYD